MKLISGFFFTLLLSVLIPKETGALPVLIMTRLGMVAAKRGWQIANMTWYAKCSIMNAPPKFKCPSEVYGVGTNEEQAMETTSLYVIMLGGKQECAQFLENCSTAKLATGVVKAVKAVKKLPVTLGK